MDLRDWGLLLVAIGVVAALFVFLPWWIVVVIILGFLLWAVGEANR